MAYYVYLLANKPNGTLYIGVTSDLIKRIWQHRTDALPGFTRTHGIHMLVWYETHTRIEEAINREKQIKHWERKWKISLIEESNHYWRDLFEDICR